jgi:BirA family transcriptional regulator, biotin operon repressor / biotin---[acetyl-CoA-carboxylase] ligase
LRGDAKQVRNMDHGSCVSSDDPPAVPALGRKLGGVLIETVSVGSHRWCVVGVGLNVLPVLHHKPQDFSSGYACLQELDAAASAPAVLARVAEPLVRALLRFEREGFAPLVARYAERDLLRGRAVVTTGQAGASTEAGVAQDVDGTGALRLRVPCGLLRIVSGEVGVRWAGAGQAPVLATQGAQEIRTLPAMQAAPAEDA